jgi:Tfp pilus assembly protein PilN
MLKTNLSTRPFYNIRAVQVVLGALALVVAAMTIANAVQLIRLTTSGRALGARAEQAETDAQGLREEARRIRSQIDAKELNEVAAAAQEANAIIDLRAFSWSDLFAKIEETLPESVRLTSFQPQEDREGRLVVTLRVQARRVQDLESFLDALENTGVFHQVLAAEEQTNPEGLINATVEGIYLPASAGPAAPAAGAASAGAAATTRRTGGAAGE